MNSHGINTLSNAFGIMPLMQLHEHKRYYGMALVSSAMIASGLMHVTETKHGLKPSLLPQYSQLFLNIDRFFAYLTGGYGLYLFYTNPHKNIAQIIIPLIGGICGAIGETFTDHRVYTFFHTIWHLCAYFGLKQVSFLSS